MSRTFSKVMFSCFACWATSRRSPRIWCRLFSAARDARRHLFSSTSPTPIRPLSLTESFHPRRDTSSPYTSDAKCSTMDRRNGAGNAIQIIWEIGLRGDWSRAGMHLVALLPLGVLTMSRFPSKSCP